MSLTQIRKSKGPRIEPWGTPHNIRPLSESWFSMLIKNIPSETYDWNYVMHLSEKPMALSFLKRISWLYVSNAFWRSVNIIPLNRPSSKPFRILSVKNERHRLVKWLVLNLDWQSYSKLFPWRNAFACS